MAATARWLRIPDGGGAQAGPERAGRGRGALGVRGLERPRKWGAGRGAEGRARGCKGLEIPGSGGSFHLGSPNLSENGGQTLVNHFSKLKKKKMGAAILHRVSISH